MTTKDPLATGASTEKKGYFIAIEGTDGSGKGTQLKLLSESLRRLGYDIEVFDFPRYDQPSSYFVSEYLNGHYGSAQQVGPYAGSLFFSLDRFAASYKIRQALNSGKIVLSNRFTGSNMAHQGTKFSNPIERRGYFIWLDNLEFELLSIPRPDISIVLKVPAEIAQNLVDLKEKRTYTDLKRDIHEADLSHLKKSVEVYEDLCNLFPRDFIQIDCSRSGQMLTVDEIHSILLERVKALLPEPSRTVNSKDQDGSSTDDTTISKSENGSKVFSIRMKDITDFLSKNSFDVNEISWLAGPDNIDFEVPALTQIPTEAKELFIEFNKKIKHLYKDLSSALFDYLLINAKDTIKNNSQLSLTKIAGRVDESLSGILPIYIKQKFTFKNDSRQRIFSGFKLNESSSHLIAEKVVKPENNDILGSLNLASYGDNGSSALISYYPSNELNLLDDYLFVATDSPLVDIRKSIDDLSYGDKLTGLKKLLTMAINDEFNLPNGPFYKLELVDSYRNVVGLASLGLVDITARQHISPRLGFEVPKLIEDANLTDEYLEAFDLSLDNYSKLQALCTDSVASDVCLAGHKVRCYISIGLPQLRLLADYYKRMIEDGGEGIGTSVDSIVNIITERHPEVINAIKAS